MSKIVVKSSGVNTVGEELRRNNLDIEKNLKKLLVKLRNYLNIGKALKRTGLMKISIKLRTSLSRMHVQL